MDLLWSIAVTLGLVTTTEKVEQKAIGVLKKANITVPDGPTHTMFRPEWGDVDHRPQYMVTNRVDGFTGAYQVYLAYSPKQKSGWMQVGEGIGVTRVGKVGLFGFSIAITSVQGEKPWMWLSIDRPGIHSHSGSRFVFGETEDDMADILRAYPEFEPYLPYHGQVDVSATMAAMADATNPFAMPFVLK